MCCPNHTALSDRRVQVAIASVNRFYPTYRRPRAYERTYICPACSEKPAIRGIPADIDKADISKCVHLCRQCLRFFQLRNKRRDPESRLGCKRVYAIPSIIVFALKPQKL